MPTVNSIPSGNPNPGGYGFPLVGGANYQAQIAAAASVSAKTKATSTTKTTGKANFVQPLFDSRIYSLVFPWESQSQSGTSAGTKGGAYNGGLTRGFMTWDQAPSGWNDLAYVNFLFNPTTVTASYSMDSTDISASLLYRAPLDTAQAVYAMNQTISFSLYFDRTFELWGSYNANGTPRASQVSTTQGNTTTFTYNVMDPTVYGVNVDILAMKQITGMMLTNYNVNSANEVSGQKAVNTNNPGISQQGVLTMIPCWVYFGSPEGLVYYGYVSDFTVTVTHFTQYMIPMRCVIDVDFALLMPPTSEPNGPSLSNWAAFQQLAQGTSTVSPTAGVSGR